MERRKIMRATILLLFLFGPLLATAQPLIPSVRSIEALTLNSRYICIGRILELRREDNGANAVVEVEQVMKGALMVGKMHLAVNGKEPELAGWQQSKARLLIFDEDTINLSDPALEVPNFDRKLLRKADEVVSAVERASRENPGVYRTEVTGHGMIRLRGELTRLLVPVDRNLERWCYQTLKSSKDVQERAMATGSLVYFRNRENLELLKRLLSDEGTLEVAPGKHRYMVRLAAYDVLYRYGVDVPKPKEYKGS